MPNRKRHKTTKEESIDRMCTTVCTLMYSDPKENTSMRFHVKGITLLERIKDRLIASRSSLSSNASMSLAACSINCMRRWYIDVDSEGIRSAIEDMAILVFSVMCISHHNKGEQDEEEIKEHCYCIESWKEMKLRDMDDSKEETRAYAAWAAQNINPSRVCKACISMGAVALTDNNHSNCLKKRMQDLSAVFTRCIYLSTTLSIFSGNPSPTRTVSSSSPEDDRSSTLSSIVECAESQVGQGLFRDIIISFSIPIGELGVRRFLPLQREVSTFVNKTYANVVADAHVAAMRGPTEVWNDEKSDDIMKMSAILCGMALIMCRDAAEIRTQDAFMGRIIVPFTETLPAVAASASVASIVKVIFMPYSFEWISFREWKQSGKISVLTRAKGLEGLCAAVVELNDDLSRST